MRNQINAVTLLTALATLMFFGQARANDAGFGCDQAPVLPVPLLESPTGQATLCELPSRLQAFVKVSGLTPGNAYTAWWVYIDDPASCTNEALLPGGIPLNGGGASLCDFSDFLGERPLAVFGRMASGVAPRDGRLHLLGDLGGMQPSPGAEVWVLVFGHGPANHADGSALARQLLTPEDPGAGAPHLGNVVDGGLGYPVSAAVFTAN